MGKSPVNGPFSIAMLNNQMVNIITSMYTYIYLYIHMYMYMYISIYNMIQFTKTPPSTRETLVILRLELARTVSGG